MSHFLFFKKVMEKIAATSNYNNKYKNGSNHVVLDYNIYILELRTERRVLHLLKKHNINYEPIQVRTLHKYSLKKVKI